MNADKILVLKNTTQPYAWGSRTFLPELMGDKVPSDQPEAELWMGAHPKAPSMVRVGDRWQALPDLIKEYPVEILGEQAVQRHGPGLPFLMKILAVGRPLSLQAHPDKTAAQAGFSRENQKGIPLDDPRRNYRDDNHKPEMLCALTPFAALKGFRGRDEILHEFGKMDVPELSSELSLLKSPTPGKGLEGFLRGLLTMDETKKRQVLQRAVAAVMKQGPEDTRSEWLLELAKVYPGDIGILFPLIMNHCRLVPGEALYLPPGSLHCYLEGAGVELMTNSDNVIRGGLTPKHIDVPDLMNVLTFEPSGREVFRPAQGRQGEDMYPIQTDEFVLSRIALSEGNPYESPTRRNVEIAICAEGSAVFTTAREKEDLTINRGSSVLIPAALSGYKIKGTATLYKAAVPL